MFALTAWLLITLALFSSVVRLNMICEVPREITRKVKVAITPPPLALVYSSKVSEISGISPLLMAFVDVEVQMNKVDPAAFRKGPSET